MRFRKRLLSGLIAGILVMGTVGMNVDAAKIQVDQQIPAEEVDSVYNQEVDSNALAGWPVGPNIYSESGIVMDMDSGAILYAKKIDDQHYKDFDCSGRFGEQPVDRSGEIHTELY